MFGCFRAPMGALPCTHIFAVHADCVADVKLSDLRDKKGVPARFSPLY